ncbi:invasion associated locus B family protein [Bartonella henselae]|nr:invasion associated locus B family protein [Bartonella henselae]PNM36664.1 invasion associated locus B family protein [Bartonella henselae str. Houston-1]OLL40906.1 invasion associated locus B family protein [Bartonella henselae]OLL43225.1 invasion associated locus B family protein [Bartonella henselae]OLL43768.1 invasion associated locus B family protein [Bartonella henselae]
MKKTDIMIEKRSILINILFFLALLGKGESFADENNSVYTVHPPHLSIPNGAAGETRRIIMQFYYWTLICDEKQKLKQGICNVTQTVHDKEGNTIFSWSLVSTKNGQAVMLFRTLPNADTNVPIRMFVESVKKPVLIHYKQCNEEICLAQSPVGPVLSKQIEQNKEVRISYKVKEGKIFSFTVPFKGLSAAVYSLQR